MPENNEFELLSQEELSGIKKMMANPAWEQLTPRQQQFVKLYVTNGGNKMAAVKAVYDHSDERSAESAANKLLRNEAIKKLIKIALGKTFAPGRIDKAEFLVLLAERLRDKGTPVPSWIKLAEMQFVMRGWKLPSSLREQQKEQKSEQGQTDASEDQLRNVDALVRQMEQNGE